MTASKRPLDGKVAFVTGAGTGNGEAIAERLHTHGALVALVGRHRAPLDALALRMDPNGERTRVIEADVRDHEAMARAVAETVNAFGHLDIAINNAGITGPAGVALHELDVDMWQEVLDIDVSGVFYCMKAQIPAMLNGSAGVIINLSSANGTVGLAGMAAYTTAKHAVIGLTRSAALELAEKNIRVCAIAPGYVATPRVKESGEEALAAMASAHPMQRLAKPEEVAALVAFLVSDEAGFITGSVHAIDGGYTAQ